MPPAVTTERETVNDILVRLIHELGSDEAKCLLALCKALNNHLMASACAFGRVILENGVLVAKIEKEVLDPDLAWTNTERGYIETCLDGDTRFQERMSKLVYGLDRDCFEWWCPNPDQTAKIPFLCIRTEAAISNDPMFIFVANAMVLGEVVRSDCWPITMGVISTIVEARDSMIEEHCNVISRLSRISFIHSMPSPGDAWPDLKSIDMKKAAERLKRFHSIDDLVRIQRYVLDYSRFCERAAQESTTGATPPSTRTSIENVFGENYESYLQDLITGATEATEPNETEPGERPWHCCPRGLQSVCDEGARAPLAATSALLRLMWWQEAPVADAASRLDDKDKCQKVREDLQTVRNCLAQEPGPDEKRRAPYINLERLNDRGLIAYLLRLVLDSDPAAYLHLDGGQSPLSTIERRRFLGQISRVANYVIARAQADWKTLEAMVALLDYYGHLVLEIEPRLDLSSHLLHTARSSVPLHILKPYYRDHFLHAMEVCLLGHVLLETSLDGRVALVDHVSCHLMGTIDRKGVFRQWWTTALLHDIGYAINLVDAAQGTLEFFMHSTPVQDFVKALETATKNLTTALTGKDGLSAEFKPGKDHGAIATAHLQALLANIRKTSSAIEDYAPALRAIMVHNARVTPIEFNKEPLSFLLILCDTIQEWNRPHIRFSNAPSLLLSRLIGATNVQDDEASGPLQRVSLNLSLLVPADTTTPLGFQTQSPTGLEVSLWYNDRVSANGGVFYLWLDSTHNLQRLRLGGIGANVKIHFYTPLLTIPGAMEPEQQIHRLREAAREAHLNYLWNWLPSKKDGSNATGAITHTAEDTGERLSIDLERLTKNPPLPLGTDVFLKGITRWRRYHEDQEFVGEYGAGIPE